jgi:hypothetical protein
MIPFRVVLVTSKANVLRIGYELGGVSLSHTLLVSLAPLPRRLCPLQLASSRRIFLLAWQSAFISSSACTHG